MKNIYIILLFLFCSSVFIARSQNNQNLAIAGTVMDETGLELIGVAVTVKGNSGIGTVTDLDGRFRLSIPAKATVIFSYIGYKPQEMQFGTSSERLKIVLQAKVNEFDEVVVTGRGTQRKVSVVGAITTIEPDELQIPAVSVSNMLGGRVPGIISVTRSGEPGNNFSEFWVRGISTFGANQSALILIDGIEGNLNDLDPADIETFSVLKDASATAVYGVRGANGVVVVTTKRGRAGKLNIAFKTNATYSYSPRMPKYLDSSGYAELANEARAVRGLNPMYSSAELELFKTGLDPDLYPNVNWQDEILKDHVWNNQHHLSISGGGENARYYMSLGILNQEAIFKQDKSANDYDTNVNYKKYNFRANIDANLTRSTVLSLGLEAVMVKQNAPGNGNSSNNLALWSAQANMPPTLVPVKYSNGQLPSYGSNADEMSPYVRLNYLGYTENERFSTSINLKLAQDLSFITPGLSATALFSLKNDALHKTARLKNPDLYYATGRSLDGTLMTDRKITKSDLSTAQSTASDRQFYFEATADYNKVFNSDHRVTGLIHFYRQESIDSEWGNDNILAIPKRYQALSGRATYSYKDTYLIEANVGYTGSENFDSNTRYGIFPAIAGGWIPSQYTFFKKNIPFVDYLKFRASFGKVGNDRLKDSNGNDLRFPYITVLNNTSSGIWGGNAITEYRIGAKDLKWETTTKFDVGIDAKFYKNRFDLVIDYFRNVTDNIFQQRANIPDEVGLSSVLPYSNIGKMTAWGLDGTLAYTQPINEDMSFTLRGNFTFAKNKVNYWEQSGINYPYQSYVGVPYGVQRGLIALGLFADDDDIKSSPKQTFINDVRPGDIKYKDVNGDGVIDDDDVVPLAYSNVPQIQYGFATEFRWKNFTFSAFFEGVSKVQFFYGGSGFYPFAYESRGNVMSMVYDQSNRWTPASYSGTTDTENPNARFPRLTYGENKNNNRNSTFWLANGQYLRLKNVEVSYRLLKLWMKRFGMQSATFSLIGDNLHVWDKVKLWDPAQASSNGAVYPLQRLYTLQVNLTF